jgi:hypothetical protein
MKTIKHIGLLILLIGLYLSSCNQKDKTGTTNENKLEKLDASEKSNDKEELQLLSADFQEVNIEDIKEVYDNHMQIMYLKQDSLFYYFSIYKDAKYYKLKISEIKLPSEIVKFEDNKIQPFIRNSEYNNENFVKYRTLTELYQSKDSNIGNKENPFFGLIFRYIELDIPYFKMYKTGVWSGGGGIFRSGIEYSIDVANNGNKNVIILSKNIKTNRGYLYYSILDTINIDLKISENKDYNIGIACSLCKIDNINRPDIIAIFIYEDKAYFDRILKAWHINIEKGIIEKYEDIKNIKCENEGYGA